MKKELSKEEKLSLSKKLNNETNSQFGLMACKMALCHGLC
jgi:hypothetical protein